MYLILSVVESEIGITFSKNKKTFLNTHIKSNIYYDSFFNINQA